MSQKFNPNIIRLHNSNQKVGTYISPTEINDNGDSKGAYRLNADSVCGSYYNESNTDNCLVNCTQATNCPIWRKTRQSISL